jgi:hypothetical protein
VSVSVDPPGSETVTGLSLDPVNLRAPSCCTWACCYVGVCSAPRTTHPGGTRSGVTIR